MAIPFFLRPSLCLSVCHTAVGRLEQVLVGSCSENDAVCTDGDDDDDDVDDDL